jgi:hypothetical protein
MGVHRGGQTGGIVEDVKDGEDDERDDGGGGNGGIC